MKLFSFLFLISSFFISPLLASGSDEEGDLAASIPSPKGGSKGSPSRRKKHLQALSQKWTALTKNGSKTKPDDAPTTRRKPTKNREYLERTLSLTSLVSACKEVSKKGGGKGKEKGFELSSPTINLKLTRTRALSGDTEQDVNYTKHIAYFEGLYKIAAAQYEAAIFDPEKYQLVLKVALDQLQTLYINLFHCLEEDRVIEEKLTKFDSPKRKGNEEVFQEWGTILEEWEKILQTRAERLQTIEKFKEKVRNGIFWAAGLSVEGSELFDQQLRDAKEEGVHFSTPHGIRVGQPYRNFRKRKEQLETTEPPSARLTGDPSKARSGRDFSCAPITEAQDKGSKEASPKFDDTYLKRIKATPSELLNVNVKNQVNFWENLNS